MSTQRTLLCLAIVGLLFVASGASCPRVLRQYTAPAPVVFEEPPTLAEVISAVNANSAKIQQLQTIGGELTVPGAPRLRMTASYQREKNFRLIADTSITGVELDMGSNPELFWMWIKRNEPPAVFYCRHDELHGSGVHQVMPIEPTWLIEALGIVRFDPRDHHEGPTQVGQGRLEIKSHVQSGDRNLTKVTVIDDAHGWILEQHLYDGSQLLASSKASQHKYDKTADVTLPRRVEISMPSMQMSFTIEVADYSINQLDGDPATLWTMPRRGSSPAINLAETQIAPPPTGHNQQQPAHYSPRPDRPRRRPLYQPNPGEPYPARTRIYDQ